MRTRPRSWQHEEQERAPEKGPQPGCAPTTAGRGRRARSDGELAGLRGDFVLLGRERRRRVLGRRRPCYDLIADEIARLLRDGVLIDAASVEDAAAGTHAQIYRESCACQGSGTSAPGFVGMYGTERSTAVQGRLRRSAGQVDNVKPGEDGSAGLFTGNGRRGGQLRSEGDVRGGPPARPPTVRMGRAVSHSARGSRRRRRRRRRPL